MSERVATVYLIGAGPGDPGLLTVRGQQCLRRADLVLYDYLAGDRLLDAARPGAELVCLGEPGLGKLWAQPRINRRLVEEASAGRCVARLKGGDPGVFGRLAEEIDALTSAGVPFEIVPGVSAATAAGAYAGVALTDRDHASCVAFVAGHEQSGKERRPRAGGPAVDYHALARMPGTLVIYMGVSTAAAWSGELLRHGRPADTPVLLVRRCSLPDQSTIETTLGGVAGVLSQRPHPGGPVRAPLVAIVGPVARRAEAAAWFTGRPLFGQTVLVTRPREQAGPMVQRLHELGARVLVQPAIEVLPPSDWGKVDNAIDRLAGYAWVAFSSANGVRFFVERLIDRGLDARRLGPCRIAAIGPRTDHALSRYALRADLAPSRYRAEDLAERLAPEAAGKRVLLVRASRGRDTLAERLSAEGALVEQAVAYRSTDVPAPDAAVAAAMSAGEIDWATATSSAIARSLVRLFGRDLANTRLAAISPLTAGVLREAGYPPSAVAAEYTADGVVSAILDAR